MIETITFSAAVGSDAPFINSLLNGSNVNRSEEERIRRLITSNPSSVALCGGNNAWHIVGAATTALDDDCALNLDTLVVAPGHRGKQVGTYLLQHLLKSASRNYSVLQVISRDYSLNNIARTKDFFIRRNSFRQGSEVGDEYEYFKKLTSGKTGN